MDFKQLFEYGVSFDTFLNQDIGVNQEKTLEIYNHIQIDEELSKKINMINDKIYILAFAEIWCPDCMINVPAIQKMQDLNSNIEIRILPRENKEEYLKKYKVAGKVKIPTFIIFNEQFKELGVFIEMPKTLKNIVAKGNQVEIIVAKRKYRKGAYIKDTIEEILEYILLW